MKFLKTFFAALLAFLVGSVLSVLLWIIIFAGIIAGSLEPAVYVRPNSILKIDLNEAINDNPSVDPFEQFDLMSMNVYQNLPLFKALCAIDAAKNDDRIDGIYLRFTGGGTVSAANIEELRDAIIDFKQQSGKFVLAYNETYSQVSYYLATAADKIYLQPEGGMSWQGLSFNLTFYKGLLDKLDISVEVFRPTACKFKSAVEPYILNRMSDANRQQMTELAQSMWSTIIESVSQSRGISVAKLNEIADNLSATLPEEALANGFVDGLLYEDQMNEIFAQYGAKADKKGEYNFISLAEYASQVIPAGSLKADKVGIIYAEGEIVDGYGDYGKIYGNSFAELVKSARLDNDIKAVVIRVNSPGGSALASDVIWREMELLKAEKPVIVSMGGYAASGGYYISAPADVIVADKLTLTGSIGVFGMIPYAGKFLNDKVGITFDAVTTNTYSDSGNLTRRISPVERAMIMKGVDKVYDTFTGLVSEGRNLPLDKVLDIAGGRVWSGTDGIETGLVDCIGGLKTAIAIAADKAGISENHRVEEIINEPSGLGQILSSLKVHVAERYMQSKLGTLYTEYAKLGEVVNRQGVQTYCPYAIEIE